jgi:hypothetical protein
VPDRIAAAPAQPRWVPITAAAALMLVGLTAVLQTFAPVLTARGPHSAGTLARRDKPVPEPRFVATSTSLPRRDAPAHATPVLADSLFDHSEDVEFILDPVVLHRGRAQSASHLPKGAQGERTVISF